MKRIILVLTTVLMCGMMFTGCKTTVDTEPNKALWDRFVAVEVYSNNDDGNLNIVYDKDTKVMYYLIDGYNQVGICPIYNSDGSVKIYEEDN